MDFHMVSVSSKTVGILLRTVSATDHFCEDIMTQEIVLDAPILYFLPDTCICL